MIFHISIDADDPQRVAAAIARLWRADMMPFPPVGEDSLIVLADDGRNSAIATGHSATHVAIASPLTEPEVLAIAAEHGWDAKYRKRGGAFGVIEFWVENRFMIEVLTPEMQAEYLATMTPAAWRAALTAGAPVQVAA